jgi:hypothetical protein
MKKQKKLELINADLEVFYVPYTRTDADIYKVHARSMEHAIQKFNFMMADGKSSPKPCRRVSLIEKSANTAYDKNELLDVPKIFSRQIDYYDTWDREIIQHHSLKEVH